jgi:hypothetical protein
MLSGGIHNAKSLSGMPKTSDEQRFRCCDAVADLT